MIIKSDSANVKYRPFLAIAISTILVIGLLGLNFYVFTPRYNPNLYASISGLQGRLLVYKNGSLVVNQPDILTQNFFIMWANWMNGDTYTPNNVFTNACINGAIATSDISPTSFSTASYVSCSIGYSSNTPYGSGAPTYIGIGSGVVSPSLSDANLGSKYATAQATISLSTNPVQTIATATITATSSIQITEAGLYWYSWFNQGANLGMVNNNCLISGSSANYCAIMIAHDSFSAISLNNGDTITITYQFNMPNCNPANNNAFSCNQLGMATLLAQGLARSCSYSGAQYCIQISSSNKYLINAQAVQAILSASNPTPTTITSVNPITVSVSSGKVNVVGNAQAGVSNAQNFGYSLCFGAGGCYSIATLVVGSNAGVNIVAGQPFGFQFSS